MQSIQDKNKKQKKAYTKPKMKHLGKLSTIIQGSTGCAKDMFPAAANTPGPQKC